MQSVEPIDAIARLDHAQLLDRVRSIVARNMAAVARTRSLVARTDAVLRRQRPVQAESGAERA